MAILAMCSIIRERKMKGFLAFLIGLMALGTASIADTDGPKAEAVLAGGCFWGGEHDFHQLPGGGKGGSGYFGGSLPNPTYENYPNVSTTNQRPHTQGVEVTYGPKNLEHENA